MSEEQKGKNLDLFREKRYVPSHSGVLRGDELEKKKLPKRIRQHTTMVPTNLAHSNLFMFNTRGRKWLLDEFPLLSRWLPRGYNFFYSGRGLSGFDLQIMINLIKRMETREKLNEKYVESYVDEILKSDKEYKTLSESAQKEYRQNMIDDHQNVEGFFLQMSEFISSADLSGGGKTHDLVKESISKLSRGIITVRTDFDDPEKEDFEVNDKILNYVYLPQRDAYFISFTPMILDMFRMQTSILNTQVMNNISNAEKSRQKTDVAMYSMLMTYARERTWEIDVNEFMVKSPYYLLKKRDEGLISEGSIAYTEIDGKIRDNSHLTIKKINTYISKHRQDVVEFFKRMEKLNVLQFNVIGRGDSARVQFRLSRDLEGVALAGIEHRDTQPELNFSDKFDESFENK
ncbi:hypothetical protein [Hydrogenovibrio marinus]|uniref:Uncharacterized protein n=1 Tax=Hydrogenovibrio marinus TaxID=28885 RepID=A0A066ZR22_HYDMR|nr:hypothetical protein [Hydrogenovibrio marinus]KDN94679.1 hypothetical protein EI16_12330 [Hydrogenovibrio marinus]